MLNLHILLTTLTICSQEKKVSRVCLFALSGVLTFIFALNESMWLSFILWELVSLISYLLILSHPKPSYEQKKKALSVLYISILSGLFFAFAISDLQLASEFYLQTNLLKQISLALAIVIKSSLFPFCWLQEGSIADHNVSALLHSVTSVQLGIYLCLKTKIYQIPICKNLLLIFSCITIGFCFVYLICEKRSKYRLACLTQATNAAILYFICTTKNPELGYWSLFCHAVYKSIFFMYLGREKVSLSLFLASLASLCVSYCGYGFVPICSKAFIFSFLLKFWIDHYKNYCLKFIDYITIPISLLLYTSVTVFHLTNTLDCLAIAILGYGIFVMNKFVNLDSFNIQAFVNILTTTFKLLLKTFIITTLAWFLYWQVDFQNFNRLFCSHLDFISFIPFMIGIITLLRAKNKIELILGLNVISCVVSVMIYQSSGLEVCGTHIIADLIVTIALLKSKREVASRPRKALLCLIPMLFMLVISLHKRTLYDLEFPIAKNVLNDIVVKWRLLDTLGEIIVFTLTRI